MWRLGDTDSQEEQQDRYNEASDGIPMLASDSGESVIFAVERPSSSILGSGIIMRTTTSPCLLFQVQTVTNHHPLVSLY